MRHARSVRARLAALRLARVRTCVLPPVSVVAVASLSAASSTRLAKREVSSQLGIFVCAPFQRRWVSTEARQRHRLRVPLGVRAHAPQGPRRLLPAAHRRASHQQRWHCRSARMRNARRVWRDCGAGTQHHPRLNGAQFCGGFFGLLVFLSPCTTPRAPSKHLLNPGASLSLCHRLAGARASYFSSLSALLFSFESGRLPSGATRLKLGSW